MLKFYKKIMICSFLCLTIISCGKQKDLDSQPTTENYSTNFVSIDDKNFFDINYLDLFNINKVIYFENMSPENITNINKVIKKAIGISITGKYILLAKTAEGARYFIYDESPHPKLIKKHLNIIYKNQKIRSNTNNNILNENLAISTVTISLIKRNIKCPMRMFYDADDLKDYCNGKAFLELNYKIDMGGSKATMKEDPKTGMLVKTENAKYIIFTVSPEEEGGTGWHLTENISQELNRAEFLRSKRDFLGPFANKYNFWIIDKNVSDQIKLVKTFPQNTNPGSSISQSQGMIFGISGGVSGGVMGPSPIVNVNLGASIQVSTSRNISYNTHEYTIENVSYNNTAKWLWDAKVNEKICDYLTKKDLNSCHFTEASWKKNWAANKTKFSAISHKSFTPSFQAVYKTSKNNENESVFEIGTNVETGVILGKKINLGLLNYVNIRPDNYVTSNIVENISVDWGSPIFSSELSVRLQSTSNLYSSKCLAINKHKKVIHMPCNTDLSQIWGYDNEEKQFKSRIFSESCLNLEQNGWLTVKTCTMNNNQKWVLNPKGFIQLSADETKVLGLDDKENIILVDITSLKKLKFDAYKAFL